MCVMFEFLQVPSQNRSLATATGVQREARGYKTSHRYLGDSDKRALVMWLTVWAIPHRPCHWEHHQRSEWAPCMSVISLVVLKPGQHVGCVKPGQHVGCVKPVSLLLVSLFCHTHRVDELVMRMASPCPRWTDSRTRNQTLPDCRYCTTLLR